MNEKLKILAINGSYRDGGITDQAVSHLLDDLQSRNAEVEYVKLRDYPIEFCLNCRECMQQPGTAPGQCVLDDGMAALVQKIEAADGYVLAAPTNFYSVTALFKRFAERLAVFGYWPWGKPAPVGRKAGLPKKPVIILSSCAAPGLLARLSYTTNKNLKITAETMGGKVVGSMTTGLISGERDASLPRRSRRRIKTLVDRLVA
jgi:multimeric flavodoxin WrbA